MAKETGLFGCQKLKADDHKRQAPAVRLPPVAPLELVEKRATHPDRELVVDLRHDVLISGIGHAERCDVFVSAVRRVRRDSLDSELHRSLRYNEIRAPLPSIDDPPGLLQVREARELKQSRVKSRSLEVIYEVSVGIAHAAEDAVHQMPGASMDGRSSEALERHMASRRNERLEEALGSPDTHATGEPRSAASNQCRGRIAEVETVCVVADRHLVAARRRRR